MTFIEKWNTKHFQNMKTSQKTIFFILWKYFEQHENPEQSGIVLHHYIPWINHIWETYPDELNNDLHVKTIQTLMNLFPQHYQYFVLTFESLFPDTPVPLRSKVCHDVYKMLKYDKNCPEIDQNIVETVHRNNKFIWKLTMTDFDFKLRRE